MPRVYFVKKARKDNPVVKKGESYYWWQHAFKAKQYSKTMPTPSQLTGSSFLSELYALHESIQKGAYNSFDDMESNRDSIAEELQVMLEQCQESLDNMPDHLQDTSSAGELLNERIDALETAISEIESIDVEEEPEDWTDVIDDDDWDKMKDEEKEEYKTDWRNEKVMEYIQAIEDAWPEL
jgi:flagellar biosynthesis chaperone FliJ